MKKSGKIVIAFLMALTMAAAVAAFTACGETGEAKKAGLTGSYHSGSLTFMSAYPGYTFKQFTTVVQNFNAYDDGTYVLVQSSKSYSGDLAFDPDNSGSQTPSVNDRGQSVITYYGTYTSAEEEGLITFTIDKPAKVVSTSSASAAGSAAAYYNTEAWTEAMGSSAGGEGETLTAEQYLAKVAFAQKTFTVDTSTMGFAFLDLSVSSAA